MTETHEKPAWTGMTRPDGEERDPHEHAYTVRACTPEDLFTITGSDEPQAVEDRERILPLIAEHLSHYAAPIVDGTRYPCLHCGETLTGNMVDNLLGNGGFRWDLVHGEGYCACCGWPSTFYHRVRDAEGKEVASFNFVLSYMPLTPEEAAARDAAEADDGPAPDEGRPYA